MTTVNVRAKAAIVISDILSKGRSLSDTLPDELNKLKDPRDRALLQAMTFGVCRWYFRLDAIAKKLLAKPLKEKDQDVYALILVGLYQLMDMRIPEYAAVTETVAAANVLKKRWAKNLVNAVLRQYQREAATRTENFSDVALYSHPDWFIEKTKKDYPDGWQKILEENNQHPPFSLRVNLKKNSREEYCKKLMEKKINAKLIPDVGTGIILENPVDVQMLPGFAAGDVSVQDGAAQLTADLLLLEPSQRVLDACAAPGGKTTHILESQSDIECVAVDKDPKRVQSIHENLSRLQLSATCLTADAAHPTDWWDGKLFDRILLDAPCSASGVIRRHPDIKLLRRATDIPDLAQTQLNLLNALWPLLKENGILLYVTCSIFSEENSSVLKQFLANHKDAREEKIEAIWGQNCEIGKQILPGNQNRDGFYFARLRKSSYH